MSARPPGTRFDERWFSTALRSIGDAVIATDGRGRVIFMNPIAVGLTGWAEAEARGRDLRAVFRIINEKTREPIEDPVAKVLGHGRIVGLANHTVLIARDGTERPIDDSAAPIVDEDGRVAGVVLVFRDVTEKRRAELLNERLAALVESSDDAIISKTLDGVITSWNRGAERLFGYTAEEIVGQPVSLLMPRERVEDLTRILDRIRRGERVDHYETRRRRKDGTVLDVSLTVSPIRNAEGEIIGASKIARDITEKKRAEEQLQDEARRKDEFLAMLAHELRNPLAAISSAVALTSRSAVQENIEWATEVIGRQIRHLARLIDDLLDVSRITRGKIQLRRELIDPTVVIQAAVEAVQPLLEERKHTLALNLEPGLRLEADPVRLEQIVVNLVTNAAKYTESGGRIEVAAGREGRDVVIRVRDNGVGIAPQLLPRVFDLFAQGDRSLARSEGGLGIGLTLVKALAELHGGTATARSEGPGTGSEFLIRLPAAAPAAAGVPGPAGPAPEAARAGARVLVVDDNADTAEAIAKLLKLLGHDVRIARSGPEALASARAHRPEVVLLDIGLPGMDGYEVASRLRQEAWCREAVFIAVTGYGHDEHLRRSKEAGFQHHLIKPIDFDALLKLMNRPGSLARTPAAN